jgi:hypothetical protein
MINEAMSGYLIVRACLRVLQEYFTAIRPENTLAKLRLRCLLDLCHDFDIFPEGFARSRSSSHSPMTDPFFLVLHPIWLIADSVCTDQYDNVANNSKSA